MSYVLLGIDEVCALVHARDICGEHAKENLSAAAAHKNLLEVLKNTALKVEDIDV